MEGHRAMNRDAGSYQLSHAYDRFLDAILDLSSISLLFLQGIVHTNNFKMK